MIQAAVRAIEYHLPENVLTTAQLAAEFPEWSIEKIEAKTGITKRHIAGKDECSSDLAFLAAEKLFASGACVPSDIDFLLLCTQTPDYFLPTTACLLQDRLDIPTTAGALDFNLGCSGYVYGLALAKGLIETGQANNVLLITAETYSKFIHPSDKSVRSIFGDAAAATLVQGMELDRPAIGPFVFGTDGKGASNLIVRSGALRRPPPSDESPADSDTPGPGNLFMDGAEIFNFTLNVVPRCITDLLCKAGKTVQDIDLFAFHQANHFMLDHLRRKLRLPKEKVPINMQYCGNTVSSTIPLVLRTALLEGQLKAGARIALIGFGVGYSWAGTLIEWN
jgi:3-oxoacyl-[acyl-carrier-protein] synthase III